METFIFALEIIGTIAFTISGAMTAMQKKMDVFGVAILGLTTAVGGGVIRDLILGIHPPATFQNPVYAAVSFFTTFMLLLPGAQQLLHSSGALYDKILFLMDTLGLGIFTVVGVRSAYTLSQNYSLFLLLFVGVITGVGGGILRDIMAQNTPYIFVKHIYACASIVGALIYCLALPYTGTPIAMITGAAAVFFIRCLSAHFRWSLPHPTYPSAPIHKEGDNVK